MKLRMKKAQRRQREREQAMWDGHDDQVQGDLVEQEEEQEINWSYILIIQVKI